MPPKSRFNKENMITIAFKYVKENGWDGLSVRYLAKQLDASTMPIYSVIGSMKRLEEEIVKKSIDLLHDYITTRRTGDTWLDHGVGYVLFAREQPHLFRCMNDRKHWRIRTKYGYPLWEKLAGDLESHPAFEGLSPDEIDEMRDARWVYVHGLSTLINTSVIRDYDETRIIEHIKRIQNAFCIGFRAMFSEK